MDRRRFIIISLIILLLVIALVVGGWWWRRPMPTPNSQQPTTGTPLPTATGTTTAGTTPMVTNSKESDEVAVVRLSRLFSQQFATYSNQGKFEGVAAMVPYTTASFRSWFLGSYLEGLKKNGAGQDYVGQTVQVMSVNVVTLQESDARVSVRTQRIVTQGTPPQDMITYPTLALNLKKINGQWLIDSARWE